MPRYVILEHDWPAQHWDFLLEGSEVLRGWRILEEPAIAKALAAEANFDHRLFYLDYEGPLSNDRGSVIQWDAGTFEWIENAPDRVAVELLGRKLSGRVELNRQGERWLVRILGARG